ncbi:hypothetical protein TWF481_007819 [Arthrobotrys musiformis]|uniref:Uncharacterized protein n=1 Tax=Arthrobotrys musiformis TaxID=47236 RepID=A0AAV9W737_9PEZI
MESSQEFTAVPPVNSSNTSGEPETYNGTFANTEKGPNGAENGNLNIPTHEFASIVTQIPSALSNTQRLQ